MTTTPPDAAPVKVETIKAGPMYMSFLNGMEAAAEICGSLAETTYDDADSFEAATGCEASIMQVVRDGRKQEHMARLAAIASPGGDYPGLRMTDAELDSHYERSKHDWYGIAGSEVRQIIGELRYLRALAAVPKAPTLDDTVLAATGVDDSGGAAGDIKAAFAKWQRPDHLRLHAGEMTPQEMRTVQAVVAAVGREIAALRHRPVDAVRVALERDFRRRAHQCRSNMDAYDATAASVWDAAADAVRGDGA